MDALLTVSEQAELNQWFDSMAQNAPEDREMTRFKLGEHVQMVSNSFRVFGVQPESVGIVGKIEGHFISVMFNNRILVCKGEDLALIDTADSEPQPNAASGWVTKTEAEARAEMEAGWQQAEIERLQAELKRVKDERDRVSALAGERDAIKADIAVVLCDLEAIATGMTGDYTPAGIANIAISRLAIYK